MERVSFKVAKALKEAGYPQGKENTAYYNEKGMLVKPFVFNGGEEIADAPTYLEVWLWLWRVKKIQIELYKDDYEIDSCFVSFDAFADMPKENDPEAAIIAAIEYLVENNLIK